MIMNGCIKEFKITPKPRELTEKEIDNFKLRYYGGKEVKPVFENTCIVWAANDTGDLPTYRFYDCGTNCLLVLKYIPNKDVWKKVELVDIGNLYGCVWQMCLKLKNKK